MTSTEANAASTWSFLTDIVDLERYPLDQPGSPERTRQLFGRLSEGHESSARVRADGLPA